MTKSLAAVLTAALILPAAATAQTMDFACPDPGTTFTYDSGTKVVAQGPRRHGLQHGDRGRQALKLRALAVRQSLARRPRHVGLHRRVEAGALWPLEVGKKIEARYSAGGQTWNYILRWCATRSAPVPGDAMIDTFLIEMLEQGAGGHRAVSRWWISPADKYAIRFDYSDGNGKANRAVVTSVTR